MAVRRFTPDDWDTIVSVLWRELGEGNADRALARLSLDGLTTGLRVKAVARRAREERDLFLLKALDKAVSEVAKT